MITTIRIQLVGHLQGVAVKLDQGMTSRDPFGEVSDTRDYPHLGAALNDLPSFVQEVLHATDDRESPDAAN